MADIYTCPMHPEIRQDHPGTCPKCGMTLEPVLPALQDGDDPELTDFRHRFWWTLSLTAAVVMGLSSASVIGNALRLRRGPQAGADASHRVASRTQ